MKKLKVYRFIILITLFIGCEKVITPIEQELNINNFPSGIGSYWVYEVTDSVKNIFDILRVSVPGEITLDDNKKLKIWEYKYSTHVESLYVSIDADTLLFYVKVNSVYLEKTKILFPLTIGKTWDTEVGEAVVYSNEFIKVPAFYANTFNVTIYPTHFSNSAGDNKYFITPNLGIVKYIGSMWTTLSPDSYHYTVWELKDYHIAK